MAGATWRRGLDIIRHSEDASGRARGGIFRVRGEMDPGLKWRGLFIEVEGARKLQMRCSFQPRDRDRMTEMMEVV